MAIACSVLLLLTSPMASDPLTPTDLNNLVLLCYRHHWKVHEGGWQVARADDGRVLAIPPSHTYRARTRARSRSRWFRQGRSTIYWLGWPRIRSESVVRCPTGAERQAAGGGRFTGS
jgi:hypothetical protein